MGSSRIDFYSRIFRKLTLALYFLSLPSLSLAQTDGVEGFLSVFELVDECDLLAAHPSDPTRMADGVADQDLIPKLAMIACRDAVSREPNEPRFKFQLARGLVSVGRADHATEALEIALQQGYAPAAALLGDLISSGSSIDQNLEVTRKYYEVAIAGGFTEAAAKLDAINLDPQIFVAQTIIVSLHAGDKSRLDSMKNDMRVRSYLFNFTSTLMDSCAEVLKPHAIPGLYFFRFPNGEIEEETTDISIEIQAEVGEYDAITFMNRHGCTGFVPRRVFATLDSFFRG